MTTLENALVWLYVKTWGKFGDHVIEKTDLWKFNGEDLEKAITGLAFPRKKERSERFQALKDLIMEKFDQDSMIFYQWAVKIHEDVIESLPVTDEQAEQVTAKQRQRMVVKIFEWDPGKYLTVASTILKFDNFKIRLSNEYY